MSETCSNHTGLSRYELKEPAWSRRKDAQFYYLCRASPDQSFPFAVSYPNLRTRGLSSQVPTCIDMPRSPNGSLTSPTRLKEAEKTLGRNLPLSSEFNKST